MWWLQVSRHYNILTENIEQSFPPFVHSSFFLVQHRDLPLWHVGVFLTYGTDISYIKGNRTLVLSSYAEWCIVNGYHCCAKLILVLEPHRGTPAYFYFTRYRPFPLFLFMCLSLLTVLFLFLGASIVCVNNL